MTAVDCLEAAKAAGPDFQRHINSFVDDFRRASNEERIAMIAKPITRPGPVEGLVAAVVSALCSELDVTAPAWVSLVSSPEPFFAIPARGYALRVRLLLESPPPFRARRVFVPESYLSRA